MNLGIAVLLSAFAVQVAANDLPPGFTPVISGTRHEMSGYSVEVPGKGWVAGKNERGSLFFKRIDSTESYHAGMTVTAIPPVESRSAFTAYAEKKLNADSGNPRYKIVRNDLTAGERSGHWTVSGRLDFDDSGAVNVGKNGFLATRNAHVLALHPGNPERLIAIWFSWRGVEFDEGKFRAESERFFAAFRLAGNVSGK